MQFDPGAAGRISESFSAPNLQEKAGSVDSAAEPQAIFDPS
jgi:hypothetical protein